MVSISFMLELRKYRKSWVEAQLGIKNLSWGHIPDGQYRHELLTLSWEGTVPIRSFPIKNYYKESPLCLTWGEFCMLDPYEVVDYLTYVIGCCLLSEKPEQPHIIVWKDYYRYDTTLDGRHTNGR
jgi:hypothetical protein